MKFVDEVEIEVKSGDGGNGCVAFRREKHQPRGGPSGGDGGKGGNVVVRATPRVTTLLEFRFMPLIKAENGQHGMGSDRHGRGGASRELVVPVGTMVFDRDHGTLLADLDHPDATVVAAQGGRGGAGNLRFKRPWNRAPRQAKEGEPGERKHLRLELKLLADVGIIGMPNVGKSTLISRISAARPKVADYPFTTLVPNLGVVQLPETGSFVVADIPGLVPGAASGAGLGARFLRHVERTRCLVHILAINPGSPSDPLADFEAINRELALHDEALARRPQLVLLNKADLTETRDAYDELAQELQERYQQPLHLISGATGEGTQSVIHHLWQLLHPLPDDDEPGTDEDEL
jgi:GTP-binding protein